MILSLALLRKKLQISQADLGYIIGKPRAQVNHYEQGRRQESEDDLFLISQIRWAIRLAQKEMPEEADPSETALHAQAAEWENREREFARVKALLLTNQLKAMQQHYETLSRALKLWSVLLKHEECPPELHEWSKVLIPRISYRATKCNPMAQAKLRLQRDAWVGKSS
ncbi:MAG: helix-turn-helix transcriptional regulator [Flavobacteriales bacterium]|jgi:transcriptional regulator with XRE-family HTH domain